MHSDNPIYCGLHLGGVLNVVLFWVVDQLCATKRFVDHVLKNMIDNLIYGSSVNHKMVCGSETEKNESQICISGEKIDLRS